MVRPRPSGKFAGLGADSFFMAGDQGAVERVSGIEARMDAWQPKYR